jgi:hypothetical protein
MQAAEAQIERAIYLEEPEWILRSLLDLGDAYANLGDALVDAPVPRRLDPGAAAAYQMGVGKLARNAGEKAWHWYDQGVSIALRLQFESPLVGTLRQRRDQLGGQDTTGQGGDVLPAHQ